VAPLDKKALTPEAVSLSEAPIGLFRHDGELCLKTEYRRNDGWIEAYIVSSGEAFWGPAPQTVVSQSGCLVEPVDWEVIIEALEHERDKVGSHIEVLEHECDKREARIEALEKPVDVEAIAEKVHIAYCEQYKRRKGEPYWTNGDYSKLDEATKEYDRVTVHAVLAALRGEEER